MLGAEQKAFWSAPGPWFLGRVTDRWCNPEENNQTAELTGKWKILKYHWIKVWLYLYSLTLFSMKKKTKNNCKKIKSFPSPPSGNKKSCELWRGNTQTEHLKQRMQLERSLQALCWAQDSGTAPSVPQHSYLNVYSCNIQSQMFEWELGIHFNLSCTAIHEKLLSKVQGFLNYKNLVFILSKLNSLSLSF